MSADPIRSFAQESMRQLLPGDRLEIIKSLLAERGSVRASELVELFGVTDETIRRDLTKLADEGQATRQHGGALAIRAHDERTTGVRLREHAAAKIAIGNQAAQLVADGGRIAIDSGTTTLCLARALRTKHDLVVVTNAVTNAFELIDAPGVTVVMAGGLVRPTTYGATGQFAINMLGEIHVDQTFLAIHSVSARGGLTYPSFEEADVKRALMAAASEVVLLADASKFGRQALVRVAPITAVSKIVTTADVDAVELDAIRDLGVEVILAPVRPDQASDGSDPGLLVETPSL